MALRKICSILSTVFFIIFTLSLILKDNGRISVDNVYDLDVSYLIKLMALRERELYYKVWVNKIIDPEFSSDEERIIKIFSWLKDFPDISELQNLSKLECISKQQENFLNKFRNINQHEYYVLIKQYGPLYERVANFCNLITIAGYQASKIYEGATGRIIVRVPNAQKEKFLYFDLETGEINPVGIPDSDKKKCEQELNRLGSGFKKFIAKKYLWADLNVTRYSIIYYFQIVFSEILSYEVVRYFLFWEMLPIRPAPLKVFHYEVVRKEHII